MDDAPETSWASNITPKALESLVERYSAIEEYLKRPMNEIVDLDVSFRVCLQKLITTQKRLRRKQVTVQGEVQQVIIERILEVVEGLGVEEVERLLDKAEFELVLAQEVALWKRDVLLCMDRELYDLAGRDHKPAVEKASSTKTKVRSKKSTKESAKESVRRSERERRSPCVLKARDKESPASATATPQPTAVYRSKRRGREGEGEGCPKKRTSGRLSRPVRKKQPVVVAPPSALPTDEPTYCLCNQISFGEMIGCDNEKCVVEWFHFECVQLRVKPKGKWFCPLCRGDRFNVLKPSLAR